MMRNYMCAPPFPPDLILHLDTHRAAVSASSGLAYIAVYALTAVLIPTDYLSQLKEPIWRTLS